MAMDDASLQIKLEEENFMVIESNIECEVYDNLNIVPMTNKKSFDSNEEQFPANSKFQALVIRMGTSICNFDGIFDKAVGKTFKMSFDPVDGQMVLTETEIPKFKPVITMGYSSNVPVAVATQESCSKAKEVYYENIIGNQLTDSHSKCKSGVPSNLSQAPSIVCLSDDKIDETPIKNSLLGQLRSFNSKEKISETTPTKKRRIEKESSFQTELLQEANSIHISDEPMEQLEIPPTILSAINRLTGLTEESQKILIRIDRVVNENFDQNQIEASKSFELRDFNIPFKDIGDFKKFENRITEAELFNKIIQWLCDLKPRVSNGNETVALVKEILVKSFPNEVAESINIAGSDDNARIQKLAFGETLYYKAIIKTVLKRKLCMKEARRAMVAWFKNASLRRNGSKYVRKYEGKLLNKTPTTPGRPSIASPRRSPTTCSSTPINTHRRSTRINFSTPKKAQS